MLFSRKSQDEWNQQYLLCKFSGKICDTWADILLLCGNEERKAPERRRGKNIDNLVPTIKAYILTDAGKDH